MEKIKLYYDISKADLVNKNLMDFCMKANEAVIPLIKHLGMSVTLLNVLTYAEDSDRLKVAYIEAKKAESKVENKALLQMIERDANGAYEAAFKIYPYDDFRCLYPELLKLEKGSVCIDKEAVTEFCTVYLKEDQKDAYRRYLKAIEALNDFYRGKAQDGTFIGTQFPVKDGKVFASSFINFDFYK